MAPLDRDPKNTAVPPARDPGASSTDRFDELFKQPDGLVNAQPGSFTQLFGPPPKLEANEVSGTPKPTGPAPVFSDAPVQPAEPAAPLNTAKPGAFTMMFAAPVQPQSSLDDVLSGAGHPAAPLATENTPAVSLQGEPPMAGSFTQLFGAPLVMPAGETAGPAFEKPATVPVAVPDVPVVVEPKAEPPAAPPAEPQLATSLDTLLEAPAPAAETAEPALEKPAIVSPAVPAISAAVEPKAEPLPAAPQTEPQAGGGFTAMFGAPVATPAGETAEPAFERPAIVSPAVPAIPAAVEPKAEPLPAAPQTEPQAGGSFTAMFGAPVATPAGETAEPAVEKPAIVSPAVPAIPAAIEPKAEPLPAAPQMEPQAGGSFTAMFGAPVAVPAGEGAGPAFEKPAAIPPVVPDAATAVEPKAAPPEFSPSAVQSTLQPVGEGVVVSVAQPAPAAPAVAKPNETPGSFTQFFSASSLPPAADVPARPASAPAASSAASGASPEEFGRMFDFPLRDSSVGNEQPAPQQGAGEFTKMFRAFPPASPVSTPAPAAKEAGAFTQMFNAPVVGQSLGSAPREASLADFPGMQSGGGTSSGNQQGAFTQMFSAQAPPAAEPVNKPMDSGGLNSLFNNAPPAQSAAQAGSFTSVFGSGPSTPQDSFAAPTARPYEGGAQGRPVVNVEAPPSPQEKQQMPAWSTPATSGTAGGVSASGATQIFTRPEAVSAAPLAPPPPPGPSAFTQIISGRQVREAMQQAAMQAGQPPVAPTPVPPPMPQFQAPAPPPMPMPVVTPPSVQMPQVQAQMPPMQMPQAQVQMPQMQMPQAQMQTPQMQMPQMQMPPMPMPPPPKPQPPAAPAKTNWMPLIIGANVLFFLIVILVLIFALKK